MKVVADENIPFAREAFGIIGEVITAPAADISNQMLKDADALMVRSVTKVNEELLLGTSVKFVGTATIGYDHIDQQYLADNQIGFSSAPGCNANSVSEYVVAAMLNLALRDDYALAGKTLGIIGVGNVGSILAVKGEALGMKVLKNDPPRQRVEGGDFVNLETLLEQSDFVTCHVPLEKKGEDVTYKMACEEFFAKMKSSAVFINSSRGGVVDEEALRESIYSGEISRAVLDVWEGEPNISKDTLGLASIATPHIAGYSFDGKVAGTRIICDAACKHFGIDRTCDLSGVLPTTDTPQISLDVTGMTTDEALNNIITRLYIIMKDDDNLRLAHDLSGDEVGKLFTKLRKEYFRRREFMHTKVILKNGSDELEAILKGLGFGG